jgi:hypothetical protein
VPVAGNDFIWNLGQNKKQNRTKKRLEREEKNLKLPSKRYFNSISFLKYAG